MADLHTQLPDGTWVMNTQLTGSKVTEGIADFVLNAQGTILASAARTSITTTAKQTNYNAKGVLVSLSVTAAPAAPGAGGIAVRFVFIEPITGSADWIDTASPLVTSVGRYYYLLYPGANYATNSVIKNVISLALPRSWKADVSHGDTQSYTYSLGYSLIL